jgi:hypothetical protein
MDCRPVYPMDERELFFFHPLERGGWTVLGIPGQSPSRRPELPRSTRDWRIEGVWTLEWTYFGRVRTEARGRCGCVIAGKRFKFQIPLGIREKFSGVARKSKVLQEECDYLIWGSLSLCHSCACLGVSESSARLNDERWCGNYK